MFWDALMHAAGYGALAVLECLEPLNVVILVSSVAARTAPKDDTVARQAAQTAPRSILATALALANAPSRLILLRVAVLAFLVEFVVCFFEED